MFKELFTESKLKWEGGSDSYKDAKEIENLISRYDFYTHMIDSYAQKKDKDKKNAAIIAQLKKLGVTSITSESGSRKI